MTLDDIAAALRAIGASQARIELGQSEQAAAVDRLTAELERLREAVDERTRAPGEVVDCRELLAALRAFFGAGKFTAGTILIEVDDDPHGRLADAVAAVVDFRRTPHGRKVELGNLLKSMRGLQPAGDRRGALMYRVASLDSQDS